MGAGIRFGAVGGLTPGFLVGTGGMDPYDRPLRSPNSSPNSPFHHSLLRAVKVTGRSIPGACVTVDPLSKVKGFGLGV